jgi:ribosomal protein L11 methyltransferase
LGEHPALDVLWPARPEIEVVDRLLALVDDTGPTAIEEQALGVRIHFRTPRSRDLARDLIGSAHPSAAVSPVAVPDQGWAERSQASLTAVRVGRVTVTPPAWAEHVRAEAGDDDLVVVVAPSMGFGTGHHPSTRLCLELLQICSLRERSMLDVGTGSGVLALSAWRLGASRVIAFDVDADALTSARANLVLNGAGDAIELLELDLARGAEGLKGTFDVVAANLNGFLIGQAAGPLCRAVTAGGSLIVGGFEAAERHTVEDALLVLGLKTADQVDEDGWVALRLTRT